jgi:2-isopropylmalate synthase
MSSTSNLTFDWNRAGGAEWTSPVAPRLGDETLRDGLQSPSVLDPPIEKKLRILIKTHARLQRLVSHLKVSDLGRPRCATGRKSAA